MCSVMPSVVGLIGDISCPFIPVDPASVDERNPYPAYGNPPLSGCDWHKSPQGKAYMNSSQKKSTLETNVFKAIQTSPFPFGHWCGNWCSTCLICYNGVSFIYADFCLSWRSRCFHQNSSGFMWQKPNSHGPKVNVLAHVVGRTGKKQRTEGRITFQDPV